MSPFTLQILCLLIVQYIIRILNFNLVHHPTTKTLSHTVLVNVSLKPFAVMVVETPLVI